MSLPSILRLVARPWVENRHRILKRSPAMPAMMPFRDVLLDLRRECAMLALNRIRHFQMGIVPTCVVALLSIPVAENWTECGKLVAQDAGTLDAAGQSVSLFGNTALSGASWADAGTTSDAGAAYVFVRNGDEWAEQFKLVASDAESNDLFGYSVSLSQDTAVVGAVYEGWYYPSGPGSAYVFVRFGSTWIQHAKLEPVDGVPGDWFGVSVAVDGDTALVGAKHHGNSQGAAYVFVRSGSTWSQQAKLTASDGIHLDEFGVSVAIAENTAIIGAHFDDDVGINCGAAYVFERVGSTWQQQVKLRGFGTGDGDRFGSAVALEGDTALVGACGTGTSAGSAYVFSRSGSAWSQADTLTARDAVAGGQFGMSVSLCGEMALVGSPNSSGSGSAYVFTRSGALWRQETKVTAGGGSAGDKFGFSVALSGSLALSGAPGDSHAGPGSGAAFAFKPTPEVFEIDSEIRASVRSRNAGANPLSHLASSPPVLGSTYVASVDLAGTTWHAYALLVGYGSRLSLPLSGGQMLLVDPGDPGGEVLGQSPSGGPVAFFSLSIPSDPALVGCRVYTQALHFGGLQPFALSNAQDLVLGY
jgi:hypothetical protein